MISKPTSTSHRQSYADNTHYNFSVYQDSFIEELNDKLNEYAHTDLCLLNIDIDRYDLPRVYCSTESFCKKIKNTINVCEKLRDGWVADKITSTMETIIKRKKRLFFFKKIINTSVYRFHVTLRKSMD